MKWLGVGNTCGVHVVLMIQWVAVKDGLEGAWCEHALRHRLGKYLRPGDSIKIDGTHFDEE